MSEKSITNVEYWGKMVTTYEGKDKLLRAIQMFARAAAHYLDKDNELAKRATLLMKALSTDRKAFRLFRWLDDPFKIMATLSNDDPAHLKIFNFLGKLHLLGFVVFDNMVWCASTKVIKFDLAWVKLWAPWFRCMAAVYQVIAALIKMQLILGKVAKAEKKEDKAAANKKIEAHRLDTAKVFFDLFTYAPLVGYDKMVAGVALGDGVAGLAGGFSSLLSLQKIWKGLK